MTTTTTTSYKDVTDFLLKHPAKAGTPPTHTRIGDKTLHIFGGAYAIPPEELPTFYSLYHDHVFVKKKLEYLTERQLEGETAPLLVDFDFRYPYDINTRQHSPEHIQDMLLLYLEELKQFFAFTGGVSFPIFVQEKEHVNRLADGSVTKDGIHVVFGLRMDHHLQCLLRERMRGKLGDIWSDLPLSNDWDKVLDEGISRGRTNWQLYGSRKPGNEAYELTRWFVIEYDPADGEFMMTEKNIATDWDHAKQWPQLCAQYAGHPAFPLQEKMKQQLDKMRAAAADGGGNGKKPVASKTRVQLLPSSALAASDASAGAGKDASAPEPVPLEDITDAAKLEQAMQAILARLSRTEQHIRETHEYTQILPAKYYEPGSHVLNRQVAFALKHTDERLFLSWVMLRSKASDFDYDTIPELYEKWTKHFQRTEGACVTRKSILYWAKQDAHEAYLEVRRNSLHGLIEETLNTQTEFDIASVLYQLKKDSYVCSSITNRTWHVFRNHRWEPDYGHTLRLAISKELYALYQEKMESLANEIQQVDSNDDRAEFLKKRMKSVGEISVKLKRTNDKNNIMREAMELFYDRDFVRNLDANRFLLCFSNGVVDFKEKTFRPGTPLDYLSKSTQIPYYDYATEVEAHTERRGHAEGVTSFMQKLFPVPDLNKYMWQHLASCLIGVNLNQTFNIYRGSGSNGKSMLTALMSHALGEYKGTVPITLVTEKRANIGGTSSEVMQLKGLRYAVMQEPTKGVKLNEGIMKELTGGDPIQARALYAESETFLPQFKLVVCTNHLFEINSNDDGTWRRIRICDFLSKFVNPQETHTDDTEFVFPKDKELEDKKLPLWAPVFASMLVKMAMETGGYVEDCDMVRAASNGYRQGQDHVAAFVSEMVQHTKREGDNIKRNELMNQFRAWYAMNHGLQKTPKGTELYEYMDKKFGRRGKGEGWKGVKLLYEDTQDAMEELHGTGAM